MVSSLLISFSMLDCLFSHCFYLSDKVMLKILKVMHQIILRIMFRKIRNIRIKSCWIPLNFAASKPCENRMTSEISNISYPRTHKYAWARNNRNLRNHPLFTKFTDNKIPENLIIFHCGTRYYCSLTLPFLKKNIYNTSILGNITDLITIFLIIGRSAGWKIWMKFDIESIK